MTSALLLARDCIIYSVNVWLAPHQAHAPASAAVGHLKSKRKQCMPSTSGRTAGERSWIAPKGLQRGSRAL
jgi:hypothetical protein